MKILLTGGAGFIGSHIADAYISEGHEVVVFDNLVTGKEKNINPSARFFRGDVSIRSNVEAVFKKFGPFDVINHHAAQKSVPESVKDPIFDAEQNIIGSLNIFALAREQGVKKIIFASSGGALYGDEAPVPASESALAQPASPYGIAKLSAEHYLRFFAQNYPITTHIFRYANVYGPRQDPKGEAGVVAIFCQNLVRKKPLLIFGDGKQTRDFVFVSDLVRANLSALRSGKSGVFNLGTGRETSVLELARLVQKIAQKRGFANPQIKHTPARIEQRKSALDCSRARKILGWQPQTRLKQGLEQTFNQFLRK